jgi:hypothetical protein
VHIADELLNGPSAVNVASLAVDFYAELPAYLVRKLIQRFHVARADRNVRAFRSERDRSSFA